MITSVQHPSQNLLTQQRQLQNYSQTSGSFYNIARDLATNGRLHTLWKDQSVVLMRHLPFLGFTISFKDSTKKILHQQHNNEQALSKFFATNIASAGLGTLGSLCLCYPVMQASEKVISPKSRHKYTGLSDCLRRTVTKQGVRGLYNGFVFTGSNCVLKTGIHLGLFDSLMSLNPHRNDFGVVGYGSSLMIAMTTFTISRLIGYPGEILHALIKRNPATSQIANLQMHYNFGKKIVKARGIRGLYRGFIPNKMLASRAITFTLMPLLYTKNKELITGDCRYSNHLTL